MSIDKTTGIIRSNLKDVEIPDRYVHDYLLERVFETGEMGDLCESEYATGVSSTYGWVHESFIRIASWLHQQGVGEGDRVSFFSKNFIEYVPCLLAVLKVGAAISYIRPEMIADKDYRERVGIPRFIFVSEDRLDQLLEADFKNLIVYRPTKPLPAGCLNSDEIIDTSNPKPSLPGRRISAKAADCIALVTFTSGTTGYPKPVLITHKNFLSVIIFDREGKANLPYGPGIEKPVALYPFPSAHLSGPLFRLAALINRPHSILVEPQSSPREILQAIEKYKINVMTFAPSKLVQLARSCEDFEDIDISSLRDCIVVGGPMIPEIERTLMRNLGLRSIYQRLVMSECVGCVTAPTSYPSSVGCLCPNTEAIVRDLDDGSPILIPFKVGELHVRGPQRTIGYSGCPEKTAAAIDNEGFIKTADLVYFDEGFRFFYFDRLSELVRNDTGGMVSASVLEMKIQSANPSVLDVSVLQSTRGPRAIIVPSNWPQDEEDFKEDIIQKTNVTVSNMGDRLTGGVALLKGSEAPRNIFGKLLKEKLRHL